MIVWCDEHACQDCLADHLVSIRRAACSGGQNLLIRHASFCTLVLVMTLSSCVHLHAMRRMMSTRTYVDWCAQGVRHGSEAARGMLPRLLSLLSFENEGGVVGSAIERGVREAPLWVWLAWLPQLLMSLQRPEAPVAKQILILIATQCPQVCSCALPGLSLSYIMLPSHLKIGFAYHAIKHLPRHCCHPYVSAT